MRLALGTAQLGSAYGVTNVTGQPSKSDSYGILDLAVQSGMDTIDTAVGYGKAQDVVADWFKGSDSQVRIISKICIKNGLEHFEKSFWKMYELFGSRPIYGLLVHDPENFNTLKHKEFVDMVHSFKEKGCLQKFGVSVYDPETVESLSGWLSLDIVQCPVNILDQRFIQEDMKEIYAKHHIEVYARSLFLQGVLLAEKLPLGLSNLEPSWNRFQSMCKNENLTPLQMCLLFAKASSSVSKWVIGVNLATELSGIMDCWKSLPNQIPNYDLLQCENVVHVDPRNWAVQ